MAIMGRPMVKLKSQLELGLPDIFFEDPEPTEDGLFEEETRYNLAYLLKSRILPLGNTFVSAGGFVFYNRDDGNDRVAPDCYIAFDVDPSFIYQFPNYFLWEVGKPPDFVMEVVTPSTVDDDLGRKRDIYAWLGVGEYWRLDPSGGELYGAPLTGERLVDGEYVPFPVHISPDGSIRSYSEALNLDFHWDGERFDILDPATARTIDPAEIARESLEAERRALEAAESQAEIARRAQQEAEERVRILTEENERLRQQRG